MPQRIFADRYELLDRLGKGSTGEVWRAWHLVLEEFVAIKLLRPGPDGTAQLGRLSASICHPSIVRVLDAGCSGGDDFIVMEFLHGHTLKQELVLGPLDAQRVIALGVDVLEGLRAAHARGIAHGDLSPANLMLCDDGITKILDLGCIHRMVGSDRRAARVFGTPAYMAPESLRFGIVDARSDIYALGVVLFEAATGRHPFGNEGACPTKAELMKRAARSSPPPAPLPACERLSVAIQRAMHSCPDYRHVDAAAFAAALRALLPARTSPSSKPPPAKAG